METAAYEKNQINFPSFPVVGIAEASDIDALKQILSDIAPNSGMAFLAMENLYYYLILKKLKNKRIAEK